MWSSMLPVRLILEKEIEWKLQNRAISFLQYGEIRVIRRVCPVFLNFEFILWKAPLIELKSFVDDGLDLQKQSTGGIRGVDSPTLKFVFWILKYKLKYVTCAFIRVSFSVTISFPSARSSSCAFLQGEDFGHGYDLISRYSNRYFLVRFISPNSFHKSGSDYFSPHQPLPRE